MHIRRFGKHVKRLFLRAMCIIWKNIKKYIGMMDGCQDQASSYLWSGRWGMQAERGTREVSALLSYLRLGGRYMVFHVLVSWYGSIIL